MHKNIFDLVYQLMATQYRLFEELAFRDLLYSYLQKICCPKYKDIKIEPNID